MDYQPGFKPQTVSAVFADGRADRVPVAGTVARGGLREDDGLYRGLRADAETRTAGDTETRRRGDAEKVAATGEGKVAPKAAEEPEVPWVTEIPLPVTAELVQRGRLRFNIYCAPCHGRAGDGDGLVSKRANELQQGTWVPPTSLHADHVRTQPVGQLYHAIANGVRKMPAYGSQIPVEDRWAIVVYVRALQRSQNASSTDVPPEELETMRDLR
jgi:mono/diheme cytochrome c family protein